MANGVNGFVFHHDPKLIAALRMHGSGGGSKKEGESEVIIHDYDPGEGEYLNNVRLIFGNEVVIDGPGEGKIHFNEDEDRALTLEMTAGINDEETEGYKCGIYFLTKITFKDGYTFTYPLYYLPEICEIENIEWTKINTEPEGDDMFGAKAATYPIIYSLLHGATIEFYPTFYKLGVIECMFFSNSENYGGCTYIDMGNSEEKQSIVFAGIERRTASEESVQVDLRYEKINDKVPRIEGIYDALDTANPLWEFDEEEKEELTNDEFHLIVGGNGTVPAGETNWAKIDYANLPTVNYMFISAYCAYASYEEKIEGSCRVYVGDTEEAIGKGECAIILDQRGMDTDNFISTVYENEKHTAYAVPSDGYEFLKWTRWTQTEEGDWVSEDVSRKQKLTFKTDKEFEGGENYYYSAYFKEPTAKVLHYVVDMQDIPGGTLEIESRKTGEVTTITSETATTGYTFDAEALDVINWGTTESKTYDVVKFYLDEDCIIPANCIRAQNVSVSTDTKTRADKLEYTVTGSETSTTVLLQMEHRHLENDTVRLSAGNLVTSESILEAGLLVVNISGLTKGTNIYITYNYHEEIELGTYSYYSGIRTNAAIEYMPDYPISGKIAVEDIETIPYGSTIYVKWLDSRICPKTPSIETYLPGQTYIGGACETIGATIRIRINNKDSYETTVASDGTWVCTLDEATADKDKAVVYASKNGRDSSEAVRIATANWKPNNPSIDKYYMLEDVTDPTPGNNIQISFYDETVQYGWSTHVYCELHRADGTVLTDEGILPNRKSAIINQTFGLSLGDIGHLWVKIYKGNTLIASSDEIIATPVVCPPEITQELTAEAPYTKGTCWYPSTTIKAEYKRLSSGESIFATATSSDTKNSDGTYSWEMDDYEDKVYMGDTIVYWIVCDNEGTEVESEHLEKVVRPSLPVAAESYLLEEKLTNDITNLKITWHDDTLPDNCRTLVETRVYTEDGTLKDSFWQIVTGNTYTASKYSSFGLTDYLTIEAFVYKLTGLEWKLYLSSNATKATPVIHEPIITKYLSTSDPDTEGNSWYPNVTVNAQYYDKTGELIVSTDAVASSTKGTDGYYPWTFKEYKYGATLGDHLDYHTIYDEEHTSANLTTVVVPAAPKITVYKFSSDFEIPDGNLIIETTDSINEGYKAEIYTEVIWEWRGQIVNKWTDTITNSTKKFYHNFTTTDEYHVQSQTILYENVGTEGEEIWVEVSRSAQVVTKNWQRKPMTFTKVVTTQNLEVEGLSWYRYGMGPLVRLYRDKTKTEEIGNSLNLISTYYPTKGGYKLTGEWKAINPTVHPRPEYGQWIEYTACASVDPTVVWVVDLAYQISPPNPTVTSQYQQTDSTARVEVKWSDDYKPTDCVVLCYVRSYDINGNLLDTLISGNVSEKSFDYTVYPNATSTGYVTAQVFAKKGDQIYAESEVVTAANQTSNSTEQIQEDYSLIKPPSVIGTYNSSMKALLADCYSEFNTIGENSCSAQIALCSEDGETIYETLIAESSENHNGLGYIYSGIFRKVDPGTKYIKARYMIGDTPASNWSAVEKIVCD